MSPPIVAVGNVKGGVAKTTTAVQLALHAGGAGNRTLLVDADPGRSALSWVTRAGDDWPHAMVPAIAYHQPDLPRRIAGLAEGYDLVVIDTPHDPAGGARVGAMLVSAVAVADLLVVPSAPSGADLDRLDDLLVTIAAEEARRALVWVIALTRVDGRRRGLAEWVAAGLDNRQLPVLPAAVAVPERAAVEDAFGTPTVLVEYEPLARAVLAMLAETTPVRA
ncbi:MAG: AAA family ATPase [Actinoallomurus sp.]|jgi:chromosome partitioning protein